MTLIDRWAVLAGYNARFVLKMTSYDWFRETTIEPVAPAAIFLHIPFPHLFKEQLLVVLVLSPTHVENKGFDVTTDHSSHIVLGLMVLRATWEKGVSKFAPDLDSKALPTHKFCYLGRQCGLVTFV